jgi:hypothetical protein
MYSEALIKLIDLLRGERRYNKELIDSALMAISAAIVATRTYEMRVSMPANRGVTAQKRDRAEEMRIGGLWQTAAIKTRNINSDFACRLDGKALYWFFDSPWNAEKLVSKGIDWASINSNIHTLLAKGK